LLRKGWRVKPSVALHHDDRPHWMLLCPECLADPGPAAQRILQLWSARKRAG
jgi:hypothetical protein